MPMGSVLVLAPDPLEAEGLAKGFAERGVAVEETEVGALKCISVPSIDMVFSIGGNGKSQYGIQAQYVIDRRPMTRLLMCVGAAGRLNDSLQIGDVVVGTATIEHDYKRRFNSKPLPLHDADATRVTELVEVARVTPFPFSVHFGLIASGDEDIVDAIRAAELRASTNAMCVAWEGSGGARAARMNGIGFLEVRAITDAADHHAADSFHDNVGRVMLNIVDLLLAWRRQPWSPRERHSSLPPPL